MKRLFAALFCILFIGLSGCTASTSKTLSTPAATQTTGLQSTAAQTTTAIAQPTAPQATPVKSWASGMYKVGTDIPEGEYVIITSKYTYFEITKDSSGEFSSLIANDNFNNQTIVTLKNGQYFSFNGGRMYAFIDAPVVKPVDGLLPDGMYKCGVHFKPGEYKVIPSGHGYYEIDKNSSHLFGAIISNKNFENDRYITIKSGQYIKLTRASLKIN